MIFFRFYPKSVTIAHKAIGTALRARQRVDKSSYFHDTVHITNSRDALMNLKVESKAIIVDDGYNQVRDVSLSVLLDIMVGQGSH
ncbi:MAG TPA: hypothetical protein ENI67_05050 [Gammaproteobacteria bacterium]|nr:hypothetical protein [Gammaproteobacteria bacterium]